MDAGESELNLDQNGREHATTRAGHRTMNSRGTSGSQSYTSTAREEGFKVRTPSQAKDKSRLRGVLDSE